MKPEGIKNIEIKLLLDAIRLRYGYDFRNYAQGYVERRIEKYFSESKFKTISEIIPEILNEPRIFEGLAYHLSITVTSMFRDPAVFQALRKKVVPVFKKHPFIKIWHAGCATGEEVYSMAILLKEEGLYDKAKIYATDFNGDALEKAEEGVYPIKNMKMYTANYQKAGGKGSFADFYHCKYGSVKMDPSLKSQIKFTHHNLVTDKVFSEMDLIICRNVLIYFDQNLHNRVYHLFKDSLIPGGFLCLGREESLSLYEEHDKFEAVSRKSNIFQLKNKSGDL